MTTRSTHQEVISPAKGEEAAFELAVGTLLHQWRGQADALSGKRCTEHARAHWITRGRQQTLWRACTHLHVIRSQALTPVLRALALCDCLHCLDQCLLDADEERQTAGGSVIVQWKAIGEAQELPAIRRALARLLDVFAPRDAELLTLNAEEQALLGWVR